MEIQDIERMNEIAAEGCDIDSSFEFKVGMELGLIDPVLTELGMDTKESVEWYTLQYIEPDDEIPVALLYLLPNNLENTRAEDLHEKTVITNGQQFTFQYTEIEDSINSNGRLVLPQ